MELRVIRFEQLLNITCEIPERLERLGFEVFGAGEQRAEFRKLLIQFVIHLQGLPQRIEQYSQSSNRIVDHPTSKVHAARAQESLLSPEGDTSLP
jgi:hypothetical protein